MSKTIKDFAYKVQGPIDASINAVLNGVLTYFMLSGFSEIPVFSAPGGDFAHSLLGTLVPPAVMIAFIVSMMTTNATIKKRIKGDVLPPLEASVKWKSKTFKRGALRAIVNVLVVYGIGGIIVQFSPDITISRIGAALIVAVIAALIAYIDSVSAIFRTPHALDS